MKTNNTQKKYPIQPIISPVEIAFKTTATTILLLTATWLVVKISKEILIDLEGMGF